MEQTQYSLRTRLSISYEAAVPQVIEALKVEGFGVLTEIDVKTTLKTKIDADFRKYIILGACNPRLAHQALNSELEIGVMLPCNVVVYEEGDETIVSIVDPYAMLGIGLSVDLQGVASEARERLERVIKSLEA